MVLAFGEIGLRQDEGGFSSFFAKIWWFLKLEGAEVTMQLWNIEKSWNMPKIYVDKKWRKV